MFEIQGKYNQVRVYAQNQDERAVGQLKQLCDDPDYQGGIILVMPDYHAASGCVIGLTLKLPADRLINPQLVGVDLGCVVCCVKLRIRDADTLDCRHNFIEFKGREIIIRKGAISARRGERCIIPLNMRDGYILAAGKGNESWNCSAPHGAGRSIPRAEAKSHIALEKYERSMQGIFSTTVSKATLDEAPQAYKPVKSILAAVEDSVEILGIMQSRFNFKHSDSVR